MNVRTRFPPSPTGFLHVGGLRTALYNYLFARAHGGTFIMRIEDTDRERFVEGGTENMIRGLTWAGITIDEGVNLDEQGKVIQKGDNGPYIQSERLDIYKKYAQQLITDGHAYYCFCTKERLDEVRTFQELNKLPTGYDGHCRELDIVTAQERTQQEPFVVRMKMPREGTTTFTDLIRGPISFENKLIDDQVLMKSDGFPTYHLAVVVDDHLMKITHAIRGEEWLSSTPKHLVLHTMFGWEAPAFGHLSLLVNEQKQKLSKRHGDVSVEDFKEKGYLPEALVNFIAFLGWNPGNEQELFTLRELEEVFSLEKVSKPAAVFNREKLNWYNQQYIKKMSNTELAKRAHDWFVRVGQPTLHLDAYIGLEKERITTLSELPEALNFVFNYAATEVHQDPELLVWKKSTREEALKIFQELSEIFTVQIDWTKESIELSLHTYIESNAYGVGNVMWPLRVALSGQKNSPGPIEIALALGRDTTIARLTEAQQLLNRQ